MLEEQRKELYSLIAELDVFLDDASSVRRVRDEVARTAIVIGPTSTNLREELVLAISDFDKILAEAPPEEQGDEAMSLISSLRERLEHIHDVDEEFDDEDEAPAEDDAQEDGTAENKIE